MADPELRKSKKIGARDWDSIRTCWIDHVPEFATPGIAPEFVLGDMPLLGEKLPPKKQIIEVDENIPGLRQGVLHESVYLLHKAAHIFGATLVHAECGMCTWSISSAYHSAYFAMKSILCFLGVAIVDTKDRGVFLVDVWHSSDDRRRRAATPNIYIYNSGKIEHGELWSCFQRALEQTANRTSFCNPQFAIDLSQIEPNEFALQRNSLHYGNNSWTFDDLHQCAMRQQFGRIATNGIDPQKDDFLLVLAFGLVHMGQKMLGDLAALSRPLHAEKSLVDAWLAEPFNRLFAENAITLDAIQ